VYRVMEPTCSERSWAAVHLRERRRATRPAARHHRRPRRSGLRQCIPDRVGAADSPVRPEATKPRRSRP